MYTTKRLNMAKTPAALSSFLLHPSKWKFNSLYFVETYVVDIFLFDIRDKPISALTHTSLLNKFCALFFTSLKWTKWTLKLNVKKCGSSSNDECDNNGSVRKAFLWRKESRIFPLKFEGKDVQITRPQLKANNLVFVIWKKNSTLNSEKRIGWHKATTIISPCRVQFILGSIRFSSIPRHWSIAAF